MFDANIQVMLAQTENYINLMKAASKSVTEFVKAIDDTAAFGYLAENNGDSFSLTSTTRRRTRRASARSC